MKVVGNFTLKGCGSSLHDVQPEEDVLCVIIGGAGWAWEMVEQAAIRRGGSGGGWWLGVVCAAGGGGVLRVRVCHVVPGSQVCELANVCVVVQIG